MPRIARAALPSIFAAVMVCFGPEALAKGHEASLAEALERAAALGRAPLPEEVHRAADRLAPTSAAPEAA